MIIPGSLMALGYLILLGSIINNWLNPSLGTALGVSYAALAGLIFVVLGLISGIRAVQQHESQRRKLGLLIMFLLTAMYLGLSVLADLGMLSAVG